MNIITSEEKWPLEKDLEEPKDEEHHFMTDELWAALDNLAVSFCGPSPSHVETSSRYRVLTNPVFIILQEPEGTAPGLDKVQMSRKLF